MKISYQADNLAPITLNSPEDLIKKIRRFYLKRGFFPAFILTTKETKEKLGEWFGLAPEELELAIGFSFKNIEIVTLEEIMIL